MKPSKKDKQRDRLLNAINGFEGRYYGVDKQTIRDIAFMQKEYHKSGGWSEGRIAAQKAIFKRIFKSK